MSKRITSNYFPHEKHHPKILILVGLVGLWLILELLGFGVFNRSSQKNLTETLSPSTSKIKTFTASSVMGGFTIEIPEGFVVEEKFGRTTLVSLSKEIITIGQNATNYSKLEEFISDPRNNTKSKMADISYGKINGLESINGTINNEEKIYFIYSNYNVYLLTTKSRSLYSVLDQIANSFRTPK